MRLSEVVHFIQEFDSKQEEDRSTTFSILLTNKQKVCSVLFSLALDKIMKFVEQNFSPLNVTADQNKCVNKDSAIMIGKMDLITNIHT